MMKELFKNLFMLIILLLLLPFAMLIMVIGDVIGICD